MENSKKTKGVLAAIIILSIMVLGLGGYIIYDKFINNEKAEEKEKNKTTLKEEVKDITNTSLATELHDKLTANNEIGVYYTEGLNVNDTSNPNIIKLGIKKYLIENNIELDKLGFGGGASIDDSTTYYLDKKVVNEYMNKIFGNKLTYDMPVSNDINDAVNFEGIVELASLEGKWGLVFVAKGGGSSIIASKITKATQEDDIITIYDKAIICSNEGGYICTKSEDNKGEEFDQVSYCYGTNEDGSDCEGLNADYDLEEYSQSKLTKYYDNLNTYKHTFKKGSDGNYYWYSSEVE